MAEGGIGLEPEVEKIFKHIDGGNNFLLSGGAGSGKTYSLVQVIRETIRQNPTAHIACMTYTNAAVREISGRVNHTNLSVSTIHDFFWNNIKSYQKELKKAAIELINDSDVTGFKSPDENVDSDYFVDKDIQYKEYTFMREGIISHDEVLIIANYIFEKYVKICNILKDKFPFIFLDEYQDTAPEVVEILLNHLSQSSKKNIIGFFGDAMQSIYNNGIGNLNAYQEKGIVQEVRKKQNRRNPKLIYELANKLRTDGLIQVASVDKAAPNMVDGNVIDGTVEFYYSLGDEDKFEEVKNSLGWDFSDSKQTKELNLTHNLIAPKAGFKTLMEIYDGDKILDYKKRITDYIKSHNIATDFSEDTFGGVIEKLLGGQAKAEIEKILPTSRMQKFINGNKDLFKKAKKHPFETFRKIYLNKDSLLDDKKQDDDDETNAGSKRDNLIKHLFKIQTNISLYNEKQFNEFLRNTEFQIQNIEDKKRLKKIIEHLEGMGSSTIEEVLVYADKKGICKRDDKFNEFINEKYYVYDRVKKVEFSEFQNLFNYLEGSTPFSTQHKIKGAEFNNVLVVLDNGNWNDYNFEYLLNKEIFVTLKATKKKSFPTILDRTQKLFYVCCTRAKSNLVVFYQSPSNGVLNTARAWFGAKNVREF